MVSEQQYFCGGGIDTFFNEALHRLLLAQPNAARKYDLPATGCGRVSVESSSPSRSWFPSPECYVQTRRSEAALAHVLYAPLLSVQHDMGDCLPGQSVYHPRNIIIGDVDLGGTFAMRDDWRAPLEDRHWNSKAYALMKRRHANVVREVIRDTRNVLQLIGLREDVPAVREKVLKAAEPVLRERRVVA